MSRDEFERLLSGVLDNDLSADEFAEFEQYLVSSPEAREIYLDAIDLHNLLDLELQARPLATQAFSGVVDVKRIIMNQRRREIRIAAMAAAAVIILSLSSLRLFMVTERDLTLSFDTAPGTEFTLTHGRDRTPDTGKTMKLGSRLRLSNGTVELSFESGVVSIISAPADITLRKNNTLFVNQGTAWFRVPESAIGFTVETKELKVVDLGTEFGVLSHVGSHDEVHVFSGKVRIDTHGRDRESTELVANQAMKNDHNGRLHVIPNRSSAFLSRLPQFPPYLHWSFDEDDGFQVKGSHLVAREMWITPSPAESPPQLVEGKYGTALSLDGNQQSLVTDWEGIYGMDRPLSTAMWVRIPGGLDLTHYSGIVGWGIPRNSNAKWKVFVRRDSTDQPATVVISMGSEGGMHRYTGKTRIDDDQWHHISVVHHGRLTDSGEPDVTLYLNGEREALTHVFTPIPENERSNLDEIERHPEAKPLAIGKGPVPQDVTFRGLIDELYLFDGAISQEDIKQLMTQTNSKK